MNKSFFRLPENASPKTRSAFRYATIIMLATLVALPVEVYLAITTRTWQLWGGVGAILVVFAASHISHRLIRHGKIELATQVLIYSVLLGIMANPFFIADIGIGLGLTGVVLTVEIASRIMERSERYIMASFVVAAITILLDLFLPPYRLVVPELQLFTGIITGVVMIILGYMTFRGFQDYSLRTKMVIVIVTVVMVSVGTIAFVANRSLSTDLTENIGNNMSALANSKAIEIRQTLKREISLLKTLSLSESIVTPLEKASRGEVLTQTEIRQLDSLWQNADPNDINTKLLTTLVLYNRASSQLRKFQRQFPQHAEIFLTNQQGINLAATNRTSDYYQGDEEWWQVAYRERIYIGQPEYDENTNNMVVVIAIAIREEESQNVLGILRTTINFDFMTQSLAAGSFGQTGRIVVYLPNRQELTLVSKEDGTLSVIRDETGFDINMLIEAIDSKDPYFEIAHRQTPVLASQAGAVIQDDVGEDSLAILKLNWRVIVFQDLTEALQPVQIQTRNIVVIAFIIFIAATFTALGLAQIISGPMIRLNAIAEQVAAGDLSVQAKVETGDETGTLAQTFNSMTTQLRDLIGTLEQRVVDRTKALATSAEVSRNLSTILNERQLIVEVVEQLKAAFNYYHVHIYLLDETNGDLIMAGGTGDVGAALLGSGHKIPKGKGLVGRAAQNNVSVLVPDTAKDPAWLPNPLLPETRSEAALPIASAGKVLGVLDVQQNEVGGLKQEDVDLLQSLANQVAVALMNARSYVDVQQRAEREARITSIGMKIKGTTSIEAALQTAVRELGRTLGANDIRVILEAPGLAKDDQKPNQVTA